MDRTRILRLAIFATCGLAGTVLSLFLLRYIAVPSIIWLAPASESLFYDWGAFGAYRSQSYRSFDLTSPRTNVLRWEDSCQDGFIFVDVNGPSVSKNAPMILDGNGELVWMSNEFPTTMNLKVQQYRGENYLTFWAGKKSRTAGKGDYYMLDSNYRIAHKISVASDDLKADLHEFKITKDDNALLLIYNTTQADLSSLGMHRNENSWIVDNVFQEIDIATGELLFQWKASDHLAPEETFMSNPIGGYFEAMPFDAYHLNSIEKDSRGNYLVSLRHLHSIVYIDGRTGDVLWTLGGQSNDFKDLTGGHATDFSWHHDARWISEEDGIISLFDNGIAWPHVNAPYSSGRIIQLDSVKFTATFLHEFTSLHNARSSSQGSVQLISATDGEPHVFIGWGSSAVYTEHTIDGQLLYETHFGARALHFWERVKSYRAFKSAEWKATPTDWSPHAMISGDRLYVSWNGATEVGLWELQGTRDENPTEESVFDMIHAIVKEGFEESFRLPSSDMYKHYRVAALDHDGKLMRHSNIAATSPVKSRTDGLYLFGVIVSTCTVFGLFMCRKRKFCLQGQPPILPVVDQGKYEKIR